ncbi:MAG: YbdK family carboxylate-amine ligase [Synechococcus sp.]
MEFHASPIPSLGMELELQLLDPETLDLANGILPLVAFRPRNPAIATEYNQATVEIKSGICATIAELEADLAALLTQLSARCRTLGMTLCGAGTHPFGSQLAAITPDPRYLGQSATAGYLANFVTFAMHVHIGMRSGDEAIATMNQLRPYLPLLLGLSASSPFWWGCDTGYASFRQRLLASRRSYGMPPVFCSWQEFSDFFEQAKQARLFNGIRDIHWDLRLQPRLGTLEIRTMDAPSTLSEALMLASFVRTLTTYLQRCREGEEAGFQLHPGPWWIEKENYFQASRQGIDANCIENDRGPCRSLRAVFEDTLEAIAATAEDLMEREYLNQLARYLEDGPGYMRQRRVFRETGSLRSVIAALERDLREDTLRHRVVQPKDSVLLETGCS